MKNKSNEDYIHFLFIYIHKYIAYLFLMLCIVLPFVIFHEEVQRLYESITNQQQEWQEFMYNDKALMSFEGKARLLDEQHQILYEGYMAQGKCNGSGTIYRNGKKVYEGMLVDNAMEDMQGVLYNDKEIKIYEGEIHNNVRTGSGTQYREDGSLEYKGNFVDDHFEGKGMYYDEDGNIVYEGDFLDGVYHGTGILYEEGDSILKVYEGDFAFGEANGNGILYDTWGKAYYEGPMNYNHINYTAYFNGTLKDIKEHFHYPIQFYVYHKQAAAVIPQLKLLFLFKEEDIINKEGTTWTWKDEIKLDELLFKKVYMADDDLDEPGADMKKEGIIASWESTAICRDLPAVITDGDLLTISLSDESVFSSIGGKFIDHGNELYELTIQKQPVPGFTVSCSFDDIQISYHSFLPMEEALFSVMEKNTMEVSK